MAAAQQGYVLLHLFVSCAASRKHDSLPDWHELGFVQIHEACCSLKQLSALHIRLKLRLQAPQSVMLQALPTAKAAQGSALPLAYPMPDDCPHVHVSC